MKTYNPQTDCFIIGCRNYVEVIKQIEWRDFTSVLFKTKNSELTSATISIFPDLGISSGSKGNEVVKPLSTHQALIRSTSRIPYAPCLEYNHKNNV
jgi:hypothetical protein